MPSLQRITKEFILKDKDLYKNFNQDKLKDILGKDYEKVIENTNNNRLKLK